MDCTQDDNINSNKFNDRLKRALNDAQEHRFKLYGRDRERATLLDAYQRVKHKKRTATNGVTATPIAKTTCTAPLDERTELVFLHGPVGVGKSGLAHSIRSTVEDDGGYFLCTEFDCIEPGEPYQDLIHAFTDFSRQIIERGDSVHYKEALKQHGISDSNGREWLVKTIPDLVPLMGCDPEMSDGVPMMDRTTRNQSYSVDELEERVYANSDFHCFKDAFCTLVRAVASHDKPIVFLFENLHWANECSLDVIQALVENKSIEGALFVGTYTMDTDDSDHLLSRMLEKLSASTVRQTPLKVLPLNETNISNLLADVFQCDLRTTAPLASTIAAQTQGRVESVWEQLLVRQETECNEMSLRNWIQSTIEDMTHVDREDIKIMSLLGVKMDSNLTSRLISRDEAEFKSFANNVAEKGILSYDSNRQGFRFSSRTIKDLVSDCILPHERRSYHYRIGRKLWRMLDTDELNHHIFLVVDQLTFSVDSFDDDKEKTAIANLCLFAGVRAFHLSSFLTSLQYLECGVSLLGINSWKESYRLCLDLYAATAEVATSLGLFERVYQVVGLVESNARGFDDTVRLQTTAVHALGIHGRHTDATTLAFELLRRLGEPFPSKPNRLRLLFEFACLRRRLNGRSTESILRLPNMVDTNKLAAMQLLNLVFLSAYIELQSLVPLIGLRLVRMSLDYGLCAVSCIGFAAYAGILCR
jgi:predicted ATPase